MILAFYAGQNHFLQMIKENISGSTDKIATLQNLFPKENHRILFVNWVRMIAHSEELEFEEAVEKDKMSYKDIKDYYQLSLFDL